MERRVVGLPVHQLSLIVAIATALIVSVFVLLALPFAMLAPAADAAFGAPFLLLVPAMYFVISYIGTAIWVALFNFLAPRMGGVAVRFADDEYSA